MSAHTRASFPGHQFCTQRTNTRRRNNRTVALSRPPGRGAPTSPFCVVAGQACSRLFFVVHSTAQRWAGKIKVQLFFVVHSIAQLFFVVKDFTRQMRTGKSCRSVLSRRFVSVLCGPLISNVSSVGVSVCRASRSGMRCVSSCCASATPSTSGGRFAKSFGWNRGELPQRNRYLCCVFCVCV